MQTTVTFTAESKTGNVSRVSSAVKKLGFKLVKTNFQRIVEQSLDSITLIVEADRPLANKDFSSVVANIAQVTAVEVSGAAQPARPKVVTAPPKPTPPPRPVPPPTPAPAIPYNPPAPNSATTASAKYMGETDRAAFVKNHGRRLVGEFPNIHQSLIGLESLVATHAREDLLKRIGAALGQWQHKKVNAHNDRVNNTVKQSLQMQSAEFKGMPVIADLVNIGKKKHNDLVDVDPMTQLQSVLANFIDVSIDGMTVTVSNCPHCSAERTTTVPDCYFISGFIEGFLINTKELNGSIAQPTSKSTGAESCVFEIRKTH